MCSAQHNRDNATPDVKLPVGHAIAYTPRLTEWTTQVIDMGDEEQIRWSVVCRNVVEDTDYVA